MMDSLWFVVAVCAHELFAFARQAHAVANYRRMAQVDQERANGLAEIISASRPSVFRK